MSLPRPTLALLSLPDFPFNAMVDAVGRLHLTMSSAVYETDHSRGAMVIDQPDRAGFLRWDAPFDGDIAALADRIVWGTATELLPIAQKADDEQGRAAATDMLIADSVEYLINRDRRLRAASPS